MKCPRCGLINPESALRCDCGYDFKSHTIKQSYLTQPQQKAIGQGQSARGGCLTSYLVLGFVGAGLSSLTYLVASSTISQRLPTIPQWVVPFYELWSIADMVFLLAIWNWRKWGVYGHVGLVLVGNVVNALTLGVLYSIAAIPVNLAILVFLLRPVWSKMK